MDDTRNKFTGVAESAWKRISLCANCKVIEGCDWMMFNRPRTDWVAVPSDLYADGWKVLECPGFIKASYKKSGSGVLVDGNGVDMFAQRQMTDEDKDKFIEMYLDEAEYSDLCNAFNINNKTVRKLINEDEYVVQKIKYSRRWMMYKASSAYNKKRYAKEKVEKNET